MEQKHKLKKKLTDLDLKVRKLERSFFEHNLNLPFTNNTIVSSFPSFFKYDP